jgi:3-hydroxyisobutyrate dehydrogenase-like beta-hydroxyacid dehydrogenase
MARGAFIGLGVSGNPMAGPLAAEGGQEATAYNRTECRAGAWVRGGGRRDASSPIRRPR